MMKAATERMIGEVMMGIAGVFMAIVMVLLMVITTVAPYVVVGATIYWLAKHC